MKKGDLILISFPFTDLSGSKKRPALILVCTEFDITVAFVSTQFKWKEETDILLEPSEINGLKSKSLIRLSKLATIDKNLALGLLGEIDKTEIILVNKSLKKIFSIED